MPASSDSKQQAAGTATKQAKARRAAPKQRSGTTRGSSASQSPVVFRPYPPWVVGAGSGRVHGPKFAAVTAAGATGGFLGRREGQKPVGFCPLGGAHQSAWSLYIVLGHTPRRRCPAGA